MHTLTVQIMSFEFLSKFYEYKKKKIQILLEYKGHNLVANRKYLRYLGIDTYFCVIMFIKMSHL